PVEPLQLGEPGNQPESRDVRPHHDRTGNAAHSAVWIEIRVLMESTTKDTMNTKNFLLLRVLRELRGFVGVSCTCRLSGATMCRRRENRIFGGIVMRRIGLVAIFSLIGSVAAFAHHSFSTEYDGTKTFNIKGTVSKVEWT